MNIPSADYFKETDFCGLVSGKKENKFEATGLTPIKSSLIKTPLIQECPFNLECRLVNETELGDYCLLFGEIVETHIDTDKVKLNNNKFEIDITKVNPLVYCATVREYWGNREKIRGRFLCWEGTHCKIAVHANNQFAHDKL